MSAVIGWDVGGAHLKGARVETDGSVGAVIQVPCPLWLGLRELDAALRSARDTLGRAPRNAVTMTGEMADLFEDRRAGVRAIADRMRAACAPDEVLCYAGERRFVAVAEAEADTVAIASANWRASATLVAMRAPDALFVDVGSTTTDVVCVRDGRVAAAALDDAGRLGSGELVYFGIVRSPVATLTDRVPVAGRWMPMMAETFATSADVFRVCGDLPADADRQPTADGADKSPEASARRLLRMIGCDYAPGALDRARGIAAHLAETALRRVHDAAVCVLSRTPLPPAAPVVAAGAGRFFAARLAERLRRPCVDFADVVAGIGPHREAAALCAPAVAVAMLARMTREIAS
jgi:(4-(4-[2-(gamma-L-glutamylamino)ethyl]phenoxymethyl)furan-2-yl)methanamine synthase